MHRLLFVAALLTSAAWATCDPEGSPCWDELKGKNEGMGATRAMVEHTLEICRKRGLTAADADALLQPVYSARAESLPTRCIYEKIDEGLSKQASVSNILMAAESRLNHMRHAQNIVSGLVGQSINGHHGKGTTMLVENIGMALESGLDPDVVAAVIHHNGHQQLGRLAHVMEAAERMHLEGFEDRDIQRVLFDFIDRNLNRYEMIRAVGVLEDGIRSGKSFETVYVSLWVPSR